MSFFGPGFAAALLAYMMKLHGWINDIIIRLLDRRSWTQKPEMHQSLDPKRNVKIDRKLKRLRNPVAQAAIVSMLMLAKFGLEGGLSEQDLAVAITDFVECRSTFNDFLNEIDRLGSKRFPEKSADFYRHKAAAQSADPMGNVDEERDYGAW